MFDLVPEDDHADALIKVRIYRGFHDSRDRMVGCQAKDTVVHEVNIVLVEMDLQYIVLNFSVEAPSDCFRRWPAARRMQPGPISRPMFSALLCQNYMITHFPSGATTIPCSLAISTSFSRCFSLTSFGNHSFMKL
jgi:hypothetical protein